MNKKIFIIAIILSFLLGTFFTAFILNNYEKNIKIYDKSSLKASINKIYDASVVIESDNELSEKSIGSGFIYKKDNKYAYILTNDHVVDDSRDITVIISDNNELSAKYMGGDPYLDLAVLRVDNRYIKKVAIIGSSEKEEIGNSVFTVGSPVSREYKGSITSGIISGKDRMVPVNLSSIDNNWIMKVLQFDASISPGNSGGPLVNINGEVIGVCSLKLVDDDIEGMAFAIPIEFAMSHVSELEHGKKIEWPYLGISMINAKEEGTTSYKKSDIDGVLITSIDEDSNAYKSGLRKKDIITKINKKNVNDVAFLRYELYQYKVDEIIEISYLRDDKKMVTKVKLGKSKE